MKKVAVVILNYNGRDFLRQFLPGVIQNVDSRTTEVIVADNASTDDSVSYMREHFPEIRLIINNSNGGFATGYNIALRQVEAEYYVLLNSDIEVTPQWIEPIITLMDANTDIAACQPKIRSYHQRDTFEYAGAAGGFIDKYGYPFCRGRLFQALETDTGQYDDNCEIFWATGACLFVRSSVYHQLGGLDDSFFAHMEEIDFCWRAKNQGYKIYCCPQSVIYHIGGGTLPKSSARKTYLNFRNNLSLLYKNLPSGSVFAILFYRILLDWIAALKFLFEGSIADFLAVIRAHFAFYRRIPKLHKERKKTTHKRLNCIFKKNIVFAFFLNKKKKFSDLHLKDFSR